MKSKRFIIPFSPPLSPLNLLSLKSYQKNTFPFSKERTRYYYFARNALWYGLDSLGLKPGDEMLMPAYHHGVEVQVLLSKGIKLIFYRVNEKMEIDIKHLESLITTKTRALYVIHYMGIPQPIETLRNIATNNGLFLIEDCALSLFSRSTSGFLGRSGDISIFCLYKTLPIPHGGMLLLNNESFHLPSMPDSPDWASTTSYLLNHLLSFFILNWRRLGYGITLPIMYLGKKIKETAKFETVSVDTNLFDENLVSLGMDKLTYHLLSKINSETIVSQRQQNYNYLANLVNGSIRLQFNKLPDGACPLSFPILVKDKPKVRSRLLEKGIETVNFWSKRHPSVSEGMFPEVEFLRQHVLEVPIYQGLKNKHLDYIALNLKEFARW